MKKTINVSLGKRSFTIDEDAYMALSRYLETYRSHIKLEYQSNEVMEEVEAAVADHFDEALSLGKMVVDIETVNKTAETIGYPDGQFSSFTYDDRRNTETGSRKFFRDKENGSIAGICAGLAAYFNLDILLVRIFFLILLCAASVGFWLYVLLWILSPKAVTPEQKCQMRGWAVTSENIAKVSRR